MLPALFAPLKTGLRGFLGAAAVLAAALLALVLLAAALSETPGRTLYFFFAGPFLNVFSFGNMLNGAVPLILGGLGVSLAMQAGHLNLGGEGQVYSGAFVATVAATALAPLGHLGGIAAVLAGAFFAGAAAAVSGFLKARWGANELITSFLLSRALVPVVNYFVTGPFLDPETNLQATARIPEAFWLPRILPPSNLSAALFVALAAALAAHAFLRNARLGYELRMAGSGEMFARCGGIDTARNAVLAMFLSGALHGLAGGMMVFGAFHRTVREFSAGIGWDALATALVAGFRPLALVPSGLFFAWVSSGARSAMQNSDVTFEIASVAQAVVLFLATSAALRGAFQGGRGRRK